MSKLIAKYVIPNLKANQSYYCHSGCGECGKKWSKEDNLIINGDVKEYSLFESSTCCGSTIGIWDNVNNVDINFKLQTKPVADLKLLWGIDTDQPSVFPNKALGYIYNDSQGRFADGGEIITTKVLNFDTYIKDGFIETKNSIYNIIN